MEDLRCFTIHMFFRVAGAALYSGDVGYAGVNLGHCVNANTFSDLEQYNAQVNSTRESLAQQLQVAVENIVPISYEEYRENTDDDEDAPEIVDDDDQLAWLAGDLDE